MQSIVFGENQSFRSLKIQSTFVIRFNSIGMQKPKWPTKSKLSTNSNPPGSGLAIKKTVTSCQICNQLSMAKNIASTHSKQRVPSCLPSTFYKCKNLIVLLWQDYQELPVLHSLGLALTRQ